MFFCVRNERGALFIAVFFSKTAIKKREWTARPERARPNYNTVFKYSIRFCYHKSISVLVFSFFSKGLIVSKLVLEMEG
jgi:hypothetical protein